MNNKKSIFERMETPVCYECDVCVAGGGVAGIAAALSAARASKKLNRKPRVILLERSYMLGGLATAGLVTIYLPICDGCGNQVCFGLGEELLHLSIEHGVEAMYPKSWLEGGTKEERKSRFQVQFNAQLFAISAEQLLLSEGVKILYGATAVACTTSNRKITHVIIEGKGGREAIKIDSSVVDTTGDADICKLAGAKTELFHEGNKLAAWYYGYGNHDFNLYMCGVHDTPDTQGNTELADTRRWAGIETAELSELMQVTHTSLLNNLLRRRNEIPDLVPVTIGTIPEIRMTRRLAGAYTQDITESNVHYTDTVGIFPSWRKRGFVYELPLSSLYGKEIKNLLVAGRCISVTDAMWDITRVIPVCAVSGEAAGAAAVFSDDMTKINIEQLQKHLREAGVLLSWTVPDHE